jgi:CRISPR-associated protein (TIGR02710 family)
LSKDAGNRLFYDLRFKSRSTSRLRRPQAGQICRAFDLWDKFCHKEALELLTPHGARFSLYIIALKKILGVTKSSGGYEMVADLINNADRKAHRRYYDDGIARLYRAMELFAQIRLEKVRGWKSGNLLLTDLPENLRKEYVSHMRDGKKLALDLSEDYDLLFKLEDPFGLMFKEREARILNALIQRNLSIGAHGLEPLRGENYLLVKNELEGFIEQVSRKINIDLQIPQLPRDGIL